MCALSSYQPRHRNNLGTIYSAGCVFLSLFTFEEQTLPTVPRTEGTRGSWHSSTLSSDQALHRACRRGAGAPPGIRAPLGVRRPPFSAPAAGPAPVERPGHSSDFHRPLLHVMRTLSPRSVDREQPRNDGEPLDGFTFSTSGDGRFGDQSPTKPRGGGAERGRSSAPGGTLTGSVRS